jgi:hypothetical protein
VSLCTAPIQYRFSGSTPFNTHCSECSLSVRQANLNFLNIITAKMRADFSHRSDLLCYSHSWPAIIYLIVATLQLARKKLFHRFLSSQAPNERQIQLSPVIASKMEQPWPAVVLSLKRQSSHERIALSRPVREDVSSFTAFAHRLTLVKRYAITAFRETHLSMNIHQTLITSEK